MSGRPTRPRGTHGPFGLALSAVGSKQADVLGDASAGISGVSDGWHDFQENGRMAWCYHGTGPGNVALTAALPRNAVLAVDFLQLVRFELRRADDPLVQGTLTIIDQTLLVDLPQGPCCYRYTGDGYGEHDDGGPYDGTGRGRPWPLLTGERGHFELLADRDALPYLKAMAAMAGPGGMLPEQLWDAESIPRQRLQRGGPTSSAMPLAWAHPEYVKLAS